MTVHTGPRGHVRSHLPFESPPPASVPRTHGRSHVQHMCVRDHACAQEHVCVREHRRPPGPAHPTTCSSTTAAVAKDGPPRRSAVGAIRPPGSGSAAGGRSSPVPACCGHSSTSGTARGPAGSRGTAECGRRQAAPAQDTRASQQSCRRPPSSARLRPALRFRPAEGRTRLGRFPRPCPAPPRLVCPSPGSSCTLSQSTVWGRVSTPLSRFGEIQPPPGKPAPATSLEKPGLRHVRLELAQRTPLRWDMAPSPGIRRSHRRASVIVPGCPHRPFSLVDLLLFFEHLTVSILTSNPPLPKTQSLFSNPESGQI